MTTPPTIQTNPLDPVFSGVPVTFPQTGTINPTWSKWFVDLREKVNVINQTLATLSGGSVDPSTGALAISSGGTGATTIAGAQTNLGILANPMTAAGDIIIGGAGGTPTRLPKSTNGYVLTLVSGVPAWAAGGGGGGIVVPDYSAVVLADSPVGFWKLNETSGTTAADSSGNGYNGTYMGGYSLGVEMPINLPGGVLLNGTSGYIAIPYGSWMASSAISLEVWVWILSGPTSRIGLITRNFITGTVPYELGVNMGSGTTFQIASYNGSTWSDAAALSTQTILTMYHVVGTRDSSGNLIIYVNGLPANLPATSAAPSDNGLGMSLGVNHNITGSGAVFLSGVLSSCAFYNKALTPAQVSTHYAAGNIPSWL